MPSRPADPARLNGEALASWYRRSPQEVEAERRGREAMRYQTYFGQPQDGLGAGASQRGTERPSVDNLGLFIQGLYRLGDEGEFTEIGNPHNPRLRREWVAKEGRDWPKDPKTGRNYEVGHIKALADGGTNTVDNIRPIHPDAHRAEHAEDFRRWGKRPGIARAFGGVVEPYLRAFPYLNFLSDLLGVASGRIRTDSFDNFTSDMLGYQSQEDWQNYIKQHQREWNPGWKPGDPLIDPRYMI